MLALVAMRFPAPACLALMCRFPRYQARAAQVKGHQAAEPLRTATNLAADPRLPASRLGAFSGIAFAIAITLLVLGLHLPGARTSGTGARFALARNSLRVLLPLSRSVLACSGTCWRHSVLCNQSATRSSFAP